MDVLDFIQKSPVVPYIRESDYGVRPAYYFPSRRLLDYLLIFIQEGELRVVADGVEQRFEAGEFCLLQPGTVHDLLAHGDTSTPFAHLDIFYNPKREYSFPTRPGQLDLSLYRDLLQPKINDLEGIHVPVRFQPSQPAVFRSQLLKMIESWLSRDPVRKLEAQAIGTQLICDLIRDHRTDAKDALPGGQNFRWIPSYLSFHLADSVSLQDMARRAHLSVSRFRDLFKREFGMPPHQYLMNLRIRHAKELLSGTDYSLAEIAEFCGFSDVNHFCNTFRKRMGMTAGTYKRRPLAL